MELTTDPAVLRAALIGYQQQLDYINVKMDQLRRKLVGVPALGIFGEVEVGLRKHHVSPEGRARIAAAQKKRWAAARKAARAAK